MKNLKLSLLLSSFLLFQHPFVMSATNQKNTLSKPATKDQTMNPTKIVGMFAGVAGVFILISANLVQGRKINALQEIALRAHADVMGPYLNVKLTEGGISRRDRLKYEFLLYLMRRDPVADLPAHLLESCVYN